MRLRPRAARSRSHGASFPLAKREQSGVPPVFLQIGLKNGLVFANLSAESLAGQLLRILHEPETAARLAAGGRHSLEPFLVGAMVRSYTELYARLLA